MISANNSQISYLVNLSSDENCSIWGRAVLSSLSRYLVAISREY
jgi:hypothetical protein